MADKKNAITPQAAGPKHANRPIVFRKTGLKSGNVNIITIHRPSVIIDSHMHIQSGNCATLPFIWDSAPAPLNRLNKMVGITRGPVEDAGVVFSYLMDGIYEPVGPTIRTAKRVINDEPKNPEEGFFKASPVRQLLTQQKKSTLDIGKDFINERKGIFEKYFLKQPEYKDLSHLVQTAVVMTMDMEYAHLDGYYGLKIYNAIYADEDFSKDPIGYWYPRHGIWKKRSDHYERVSGPAGLFPEHQTKTEYDHFEKSTKGQGIIGAYPKSGGQFEAMRVRAVPVMAPKSETTRYEPWHKQLQYTEMAMLTHPLKMLPMYHFDPRRWQFRKNQEELFNNIRDGGLYLGFKMYTAQGYRPWDINRLPILTDFYAECSRLRIPILNHCTPKGAVTVEQDLYYDFKHPNDSDEERKEKKAIAQEYEGIKGIPKRLKSNEIKEYFSETFVSPGAWRKVLESTVKGRCLRDLHLCLAHFGGPTDQGLRWSEQCIEMMVEFPNFYVDISSSFASATFRDHFKDLMQSNKHYGRIRDRVLFGTDWYMTLLYTAPFHGMNYWDYCTKTKVFLDEFDPSLWPRFTMHNPYRFYRLSEQVPRIAESIIARVKSVGIEDAGDEEIPECEITKIRKEAAWIRQANDCFGI